MKIFMKKDIGVANKMALVLGSSTSSVRICARSMPACKYLQFMVATSEGLQ